MKLRHIKRHQRIFLIEMNLVAQSIICLRNTGALNQQTTKSRDVLRGEFIACTRLKTLIIMRCDIPKTADIPPISKIIVNRLPEIRAQSP